MKKYLLLIFILSFFKINSQNIKVYSGTYKGGVAKYQYFENKDYERIFDGYFHYSSDINNTTINGNFKNNQKIGVWTYTDNVKAYNEIIKIEGKYLNDKKNGFWTYSKNQLDNKSKSYSITLNFHNDTIIGKFNIPYLKGEFDNSGKFIGIWNYKKDDTEFIAEFKDNIIIKLINRSISDGKIYFKYIPVLDSIKFDELRIKSPNKEQKAEFFFERNSFIDKSYSVYGVEYYDNLNGFELFIETVKKLFNNLDCLDEHNFSPLVNNIKLTNPEIIITKNIHKDIQITNDALNDILHGNEKKQNNNINRNERNLETRSSYSLSGRKTLNNSRPIYNCKEEGIVVVQITVDKNGNVIDAKPGVRGTTNKANCLFNQAKIAAMNTKWTTSLDGAEKQIGTIQYNFSNRFEQIENNKEINYTLLDSNKNPINKSEDIEENDVFNSAGVEVIPEFPGGPEKMKTFIKNNFIQPKEPSLNGYIITSFIVEIDGSLSDIKILKDPGFGTNQELIRVMGLFPKWKPAQQNGKKVRCSYLINLKIDNNK